MDFLLCGRKHLLFCVILVKLFFLAFISHFSVPPILKPFIYLTAGEPRAKDELLLLFSGRILVRLLEDFFELEYGVEWLLAQRHVPIAAPSQVRVTLLFGPLHLILIFHIFII